MRLCQHCIWFDAPKTAYIGTCQLYQAHTACNHENCPSFAPLPTMLSFESPAAPPPSAPVQVAPGTAHVRRCRACGSTNMGPKACNDCRRPWWY